MTQPPSSRPPHPLDADDSYAARLGAEIRRCRKAQGLTLKALASMIGFSLQHLSEVERAKAPMSGRFVATCDLALEADGSLLDMFEAVVHERAMQRQEQSVARQRSEGEIPDAEYEALTSVLRLTRYAGQQHPSEAGEDVDLSRRSLLGAGVGAVAGLGVTTVPAAARSIDPELVSHWKMLLSVLNRHDAMYGPHEVLSAVRHEIDLIAQHRRIATGELRTPLLRVEARWSEFASWLSKDVGDRQIAEYWTDRCLRLAQEGGYQDMVAWVLMNQSRQAAARHDPPQAITLADAALRTTGTSGHIRALCALRVAYGQALADDTASCQRSLDKAYQILADADIAQVPRDDLGGQWITHPYLLADEARCWLHLQPAKAIDMYENALRLWPSHRMRGRGIHQARLAVACSANNQPDRAAAEGHKALEFVRTTKSTFIRRELNRLDQELAGFDMPAVGEFREALAGV